MLGNPCESQDSLRPSHAVIRTGGDGAGSSADQAPTLDMPDMVMEAVPTEVAPSKPGKSHEPNRIED